MFQSRSTHLRRRYCQARTSVAAVVATSARPESDASRPPTARRAVSAKPVCNATPRAASAACPARAIPSCPILATLASASPVSLIPLATITLVSVPRTIVAIPSPESAVSLHILTLDTVIICPLTVIDECASGKHDCDKSARCVDTDDSYICVCPHGFLDHSPDPLYKPGRLCVAGKLNSSLSRA